jgi:hypothetical protein
MNRIPTPTPTLYFFTGLKECSISTGQIGSVWNVDPQHPTDLKQMFWAGLLAASEFSTVYNFESMRSD